jgi:ribosomal RNA-processing protein 9
MKRKYDGKKQAPNKKKLMNNKRARAEESESSDSDFDEMDTLFNTSEISAATLSRNERILAQKERKVPKMESVRDVRDDSLSTDEKRVQIAKKYLEQIKEFEEEQAAAANDFKHSSKDPIAERLKKEALKHEGRIPTHLARNIAAADDSMCQKVFFKGHKKPPTCLSVTPDFTRALTGSKDCCLINWDLATGKKLSVIRGHRNKETKGHTAEVLSCAICPRDVNIAASGGRDNVIKLWDLRTANNAPIGELTGHFGAIYGLCFQLGTTTLFSASQDRTVKVWDVAEKTFVETLYGHENEVLAVDSLHSYRVLSASSDHTVRLWKVEEETQLLFKSHNQPIDCAKMIRENIYVSAGQSGNIHVFNRAKRKPVHTFTQTSSAIDKTTSGNLGWISSLAAVQYSDLFIAGSDFGQVDFYSIDSGFVRRVGIPAQAQGNRPNNEYKGWINGLATDYDKASSQLTIVGVSGSEHRLGRWESQNGVQNGLFIMRWNLLSNE